jgi:hypothetical protein
MNRFRLAFASLFFALGGLRSDEAVAHEDATSPPELVPGEDVAHWSGLPVWDKEARKLGFELPLPLGIAANAFSAKHNFDVPKVTIGGGGGGLLDIGPLVRVRNAAITETAWTARFDAWVFPFLDLYAIAGYVDGKADIDLRPAVLPVAPARVGLNLKFEGPTVGLGGTLAAGFRPIEDRSTIVFGLIDLNFTWTFLDFDHVVASLDPVDVVVFSPRLGVRERILENSSLGEVHASVWGGAMYQGVQEDITGRLGILDLNFHANVEAVNPWSTIVGGRLEIGRNAALTIEAGLGDRRSVMLELAIRF